jgi:GNAT superfamily N-acetyltransferase
MAGDATVRRLVESDASAWFALRREMLLDTPLAFSSSPEDDHFREEEVVRRYLAGATGGAAFGAFAPHLVGALGVLRDAHRKAAHKAWVWGMYVQASHRRRGLGRRLLEAAIAHARTLGGVRQVHLGVSDATPAARTLYEGLGFRRWGTEPRGVFHDGRYADEHHMVLRFDA